MRYVQRGVEALSLARITVSGHPGSGTSTLATAVAQKTGWNRLNGGDIFREEATRREIELEEFSRLCLEDESVDRMLDEILQSRISDSNGPEIVESRLAGWWAFRADTECVRIWLEVNEQERARRLYGREGGDVATQQAKGRERMEADNARYQRLYDIDMSDLTPYSLVIESDNLAPQQVLELTLDALGLQ